MVLEQGTGKSHLLYYRILKAGTGAKQAFFLKGSVPGVTMFRQEKTSRYKKEKVLPIAKFCMVLGVVFWLNDIKAVSGI